MELCDHELCVTLYIKQTNRTKQCIIYLKCQLFLMKNNIKINKLINDITKFPKLETSLLGNKVLSIKSCLIMYMPYTIKFFVITYDIDSKSIFNIRKCHYSLCCSPLYRYDMKGPLRIINICDKQHTTRSFDIFC